MSEDLTVAGPGDGPEGGGPRRRAGTARRARRSETRRGGGAYIAWAFAILVAIGGLGVGVWFGLRAMSERTEATRRLEEALTALREADGVVVQVDSVIGGEISSDAASMAIEARSALESAVEEHEAAAELLALARPGLSDGDRGLADAARASAQARAQMLRRAEPLLDANRKAALALGPSAESWQLMLDAQKLADDAVKQYNLHTEAGVRQSDALTSRAREKLERARALMSSAASAFPEAGLETYVGYADAELAALAKSKTINAAWLKGDKASANSMLGDFNDLESKASGIGKKLEAPSAPISKAFDLLIADVLPTYQEARDAAAKADEALVSLGGN